MPRRDFTKVPFAAAGDVTSIPTTVQPDGSVSMAAGFGFDYQRDNGAGGGTPDPLAKSIPRDATNGILNEITASIGEIQLNGLAIWAASAAPYPINATVRHNNTNWRSTVENNSAKPGLAPLANWIDTTAKIVQATESEAGTARIATTSLARGGTNDTDIMTPLKTRQAIGNLLPVQATTDLAGIARIATAALATAGTDNITIITPALLKQLFPKRAFSANDFIRIPDVPGGLIIQWVLDAPEAKSAGDMISFPVPFTTARLGVVATLNVLSALGLGQTANIVVSSTNLNNFQYTSGGTYGGGAVAYVLAWGY